VKSFRTRGTHTVTSLSQRIEGEMKIQTKSDLEKMKERGLRNLYPKETKISVGMATCGLSTGAGEVFEAIQNEVEKRKLPIQVNQTGCIGFCQREPVVDILEPGKPRIFYQEITPEKAVTLVHEWTENKVVKDWLFCKMEKEDFIAAEDKFWDHTIQHLPEGINGTPHYHQVPFYSKQLKIALRNCGFINPDHIEEYIARGGYFSLYKALFEMKREEIIEEVKRSGLRGRGGAGFPTGDKWESCRRSKGDHKYVLCNADEGDPGAYMDRSVLEGDPHSVIEGMIIGAYAIGADEGFIYVRDEYPLAIQKLRIAIQQSEERGLLGDNILGSGFSLRINLFRGGGAFVCGESTALMASIEGKVGEPRAKHIHTTESGLWDRPSNLNNVETWNNVPIILSRGSGWYSQIGTEKSKGTKVFSIVGKVKNTGLIEVPMGITLREIVFDIGGGIPDGKKFKAVQTGGPSGGCIPESLIDLPVDFDRLTEAGSMMGSGGMIVMDESTCMVDVAKYFMGFLKDESCGKCTSCREGTKRMYEILTEITEGRGTLDHIALLEELGWVTAEASLCQLGGTAPNPVLSTIRYFREEYEEHILHKRCPAKICRALLKYSILSHMCTSCGRCAKVCPAEAITGKQRTKKEKGKPFKIDPKKCIKCGMCFEACKFKAVEVQ
jgi:NADH:ubiquinone oxidoreductase subunit F (NADH-binding)/NAD-dependent dihydropyrimidine dehydrogenase PreA subunit/(2Fe-2S) ferredoxin